jgi:hypothetical protein
MIKLVFGDLILNVISAYAPQVGLSDDVKRRFWEDLDDMVREVSSSEKIFIGGDLNGHVGTAISEFERVYGGFGYGQQNQEGEDILKNSHLITFNSGKYSSQIDFVLTRREERPNCMNCKVIPGDCVAT